MNWGNGERVSEFVNVPTTQFYYEIFPKLEFWDFHKTRTRGSDEENEGMKLTESERQEFIALAEDTYDPGLWTEEDYPALRAAKEKYEREQQEESALRRGHSGTKVKKQPVPKPNS
jgi:hypothetical protein